MKDDQILYLTSVQICEGFSEELDSVVDQGRFRPNRFVRIRNFSAETNFAD